MSQLKDGIPCQQLQELLMNLDYIKRKNDTMDIMLICLQSEVDGLRVLSQSTRRVPFKNVRKRIGRIIKMSLWQLLKEFH